MSRICFVNKIQLKLFMLWLSRCEMKRKWRIIPIMFFWKSSGVLFTFGCSFIVCSIWPHHMISTFAPGTTEGQLKRYFVSFNLSNCTCVWLMLPISEHIFVNWSNNNRSGLKLTLSNSKAEVMLLFRATIGYFQFFMQAINYWNNIWDACIVPPGSCIAGLIDISCECWFLVWKTFHRTEFIKTHDWIKLNALQSATSHQISLNSNETN